MRPARLSAALAALFPAGGVLGAELHYATAATGARALLTPPEWQAIRHCRPIRIRDFTAGRLCARRALQALGVSGFSLLAAADRRPLWPVGIVGSITHTQGYSAAVVARGNAILSLGLDTERISAVHPRLWPLFGIPGEIDWLWRLSAEERPQAAGLIFAAKEAYFKCQYPLMREPLGFDAIEIEALPQLQRAGSLRMRLQKGRLSARLAAATGQPTRLEASYRLHGPFITVALALPAAALDHRVRPQPQTQPEPPRRPHPDPGRIPKPAC